MTGRRYTERRPPRVGLYGLLGASNIGNDASMEAILRYLQADHPDAIVDAMCPGPDQVHREYGIEASPLLREVDLPRAAHGALEVDRTLRVHGHDNIFGLGDCAAVPAPTGGFYAPTAQNAERQGPVAAANIVARSQGRPADHAFDYTPIGTLASLGHREAVAQLKGFEVAGIPAWFLWRGIYLSKLPRFSRKLQVAFDWISDLVSPAEIAYLPLGRYAAAQRSGGEPPPSGEER